MIKFRAKSIHSGEWVYGNFIHSKRFTGCFNEFRIHEQETGIESDVYPDTVCQFTGFYDSLERELYEEDIVSLPGYDWTFVIKFSQKHGCYMLFNFQNNLKFHPLRCEGITINEDYIKPEYCLRIGNTFGEKTL